MPAIDPKTCKACKKQYAEKLKAAFFDGARSTCWGPPGKPGDQTLEYLWNQSKTKATLEEVR